MKIPDPEFQSEGTWLFAASRLICGKAFALNKIPEMQKAVDICVIIFKVVLIFGFEQGLEPKALRHKVIINKCYKKPAYL